MIQDYSNPGLVHLAGQSQQELEQKKSAYMENTPLDVQWQMPNFNTSNNKWTVKGFVFPRIDNKSN